MPQNFQSIAVNQLYANESPFVFWEGSTVRFVGNWLGSGELSSPANELYRNKDNVSSTKLTDETTVAGRSQTSKILSLDIPGDYVLFFSVSDGGNTRIKAISIKVAKKGVF